LLKSFGLDESAYQKIAKQYFDLFHRFWNNSPLDKLEVAVVARLLLPLLELGDGLEVGRQNSSGR